MSRYQENGKVKSLSLRCEIITQLSIFMVYISVTMTLKNANACFNKNNIIYFSSEKDLKLHS